MTISAMDIENLLGLDGEVFVKEAYRKILCREADRGGIENLLGAMQRGMEKEVIIFELAVSDEAISKQVAVNGLHMKKISVKRLLAEEGSRFVNTSYIAILGRSADENGKNAFLHQMMYSGLSKIELIHALMTSAEGKALGVVVSGFGAAYMKRKVKSSVYKVPVFGKALKNGRMQGDINEIINSRIEHEHSRVDQTHGMYNDLMAQMSGMRAELSELKYKMDNADRIGFGNTSIMEKKNALTTGVAYKKFEDEMRGSREEIKKRLNTYEAVVLKVREHNGDDLFALDLGCGRGEWLELMRDTYKVHSLGVDSDATMLTDCETNGLMVINADLVTFLKNAESESVDIITMFQVAEHLPVALLYDVINEIYRVLRKGGACILETPNPENMIIGSCNYYLDPTHITKLPPALLKTFVEGAGMSDAEVVRLHPYGAIDVATISDGSDENKAIKQMAGFFNNFADYAVVAYKN